VPADKPRYRFGPFELDTSDGVLSRSNKQVKLQDLPFRLLVMLVEQPNEIVAREDVCKRLWPDNTFVDFDRSLGVAVRKVREALDDDAEAPRYVETLPRRGFRFLAPVTVQIADPKDAAQATDAAKDKDKELRPNTTEAYPEQPHLNRYLVIAGIVLLTVGAGLYTFRSLPRRAPTTADARSFAPPVRIRRSVAVLGFRNLPGRKEDNWLSAAFSEMLNTELAAGGELRLVSGEDVARAKSELPLTDEDSLAKATLERLRTDPGADVVVLGSYTLLSAEGKSKIRLDVRMQDTAAGETIAEEALSGNESDLFDLASQVGNSLRHNLGLGPLSSEVVTATRAALPANEKAARLYAEGRAKLWAFDFHSASDLLTKAIAADPNYPLAHAALSDALWHSGYQVRAKAEAQRALELSNQLSREQHLLVEGQYRRAMGDWPKTIDAYQALFHLFPDSLDYGLLLASSQFHIKPSDSLETLARLRHLPAPLGDDARIDMTEASAWISTDLNQARAAAKRAIAKASAQGSHVIVSRTYAILCQQAPSMGATEEAVSVCENALQTAIAAKDRTGEGLMLNDLASIYYLRGDIVRAEVMFRQAIKRFRDVGDSGDAASALSNLAALRLVEGDLPEAKKSLEESIPEYQAVEDKEGVALSLNNLGDLSRQLGNLEVAETTYRQAKATAQEIDDKDAIGYVLTGLGDLYLDRGDLAVSRKSYEESLALRKQMGETQLAAETQVALAYVSIEEGHPADAETAVREYEQQFHREHQADDELHASQVLIDAFLAQGKLKEARHEADASDPLAAKSQNIIFRLEFALASARVLLAEDHPERARPPLEHALREARGHGLLGVEFEARLILAELAKRTQHGDAAKAQLSALEESARSKGFGLIVHHAAELNK
jgi:DNA-binding winged helix-turn-helix (wHTH) protein/tetratricopeptide (TPR) repeat protein